MSSWNSSYKMVRKPRIMPNSSTFIEPVSSLIPTSQHIISKPSFHILISTSGKMSLYNMLSSLKNELTINDAITIVFDGEDAFLKSSFSYDWLEGHKSIINIIEQTPNLGFWGHGVRNKYQELLNPKTTFIMHADDDDIYVEGSFTKLRTACTDPNTLYIARCLVIKKNTLIPSQLQKIVKDDIGTPCGIIPFEIARHSSWGLRYGGDFDYYDNLQKYIKNIKFLNLVIYNVL